MIFPVQIVMIMIENCKLNQFTINKISHPIYNDNDDSCGADAIVNG